MMVMPNQQVQPGTSTMLSTRGHDMLVNWVTFTLDGQLVLSGGEDRTVSG